jgi:ABC-type branched-subunit amino acid transport system ATPase component
MDEPSIGLAPKLLQDLRQPIRALQQQTPARALPLTIVIERAGGLAQTKVWRR